jgi:hypothetical protein
MPIQQINLGSSANDGSGDSARIAGQKINANFNYLNNALNNNASVQNSYSVPPNNTIATMVADQDNQTSGNFQYVGDASADGTVTVGYAYYEYLGTTNASLADYRKLSDSEIIGLIAVVREVRIGLIWFYPPNTNNPQQVTVGQEFRGFPDANSYVAGIVLDATNFDIYDETKAKLILNF